MNSIVYFTQQQIDDCCGIFGYEYVDKCNEEQYNMLSQKEVWQIQERALRQQELDGFTDKFDKLHREFKDLCEELRIFKEKPKTDKELLQEVLGFLDQGFLDNNPKTKKYLITELRKHLQQ